MGTEQRIDSLTGIRGLAALLVVYSHLAEYKFFPLSPLLPGEVGVMVFFTLSGFLMSFLYGEKDFNYGSVVHYGISRFSRIAPAYLFIVVASYLIYNLVDGQFVYAITHQNLLRHLMFSGNVSALWSIPPEVQFYGVFVGVWFALWAFRTQGNAAFLVMILVGVFALMSYRSTLPGTFVGSKIHYFFTGVIFGLVRGRTTPGVGMAPLAVLQVAVLVAIGLVLAGVLHIDFGSKKHFYSSLETALFAGIVIFVFSFDTGLSKRLLGNRLIAMCGECSFSMYLLNIPVIYVALKLLGQQPHTPGVAAATTLAILALAWLMYRTIELPGSRLLRNLGTRLLLKPQPVVIAPVVEAPTSVIALEASPMGEPSK
ncbi:acyltransferase [Pseudoxanthomonas sp. GM95]|uniref:acyltransferase family protein n=1 Tax=Pseudoxanthomonas sp. GM95 TaxID=1881043 RepID=UPI000B89E5EF|nr:acyltransferase [Pseudoxanthomonas sp. GM95]